MPYMVHWSDTKNHTKPKNTDFLPKKTHSSRQLNSSLVFTKTSSRVRKVKKMSLELVWRGSNDLLNEMLA